MSFRGFSDEDIQNLQKSEDNSENTELHSSRDDSKKIMVEQHYNEGVAKSNKFLQKGGKPYSQIPLPEAKRLATSVLRSLNLVNKETDTKLEMPNFNRILYPTREVATYKTELKEVGTSKTEIEFDTRITNSRMNNVGSSSSSPQKGPLDDDDSVNDVVVDTSNYSIFSIEPKGMNMVEYEKKRKIIEGENRKRKDLIARALALRTKKTQDEAHKLNEIHSEFKKLDASLANDVTILRKQIETAIVEFATAEKRYHKAEKEYLDCKLFLQQKLERKDMLTEHLCTIIQKNEERKADKLNELIGKLSVSSPLADELNMIDSDGRRVENMASNTDGFKFSSKENVERRDRSM